MSTKTVLKPLGVLLLLGTLAQAQTAAPPERAAAMTERQHAWLTASPGERIRRAEALGEEGAEAYAATQGYTPLLKGPDKALRQGFDQVYRAKDGRVVVLEAKGGSSPLGKAYGHAQGTAAWAVEAARETLQNTKASAAEKQAAQAVLEAARDGRLTVQVIRTQHCLGEPVAAVLEATFEASPAEARAAGRTLKELTVASGRTAEVATAAVRAAEGTNTAAQTAKRANAAVRAVEGAGEGVGAASALAKAGKAAGVAGVAVDVGMRAYSAAQTEEHYRAGELTNEQRIGAHARNAAGMAGGLGGAWAGAEAGAAFGGAVGTCFGGVGAPVGAAIGGAIGGVGGYFGGEFAAEQLVGGVMRLWR